MKRGFISIIALILVIPITGCLNNYIDDQHRISAKEAFEMITQNEDNNTNMNGLTRIFSRGEMDNGKATEWFVYFTSPQDAYFIVKENGEVNQYTEQHPFSYSRGLVSEWNIDLDDAVSQANEFECVKKFYEDYPDSNPHDGEISISSLDDETDGGCSIEISYYTIGGIGLGMNELWVKMDGTTGDLIDYEFRP